MTRLSIWNDLRPFSVGFDDLFDHFNNTLELSQLKMMIRTKRKLYIEVFQKESLVEHLLWRKISKLMVLN